MRTLLLDPFGGMAGDMLLAALLDLEHPAFDLSSLRAFVDRLLPGACTLEVEETTRGALRGRLLRVETNEREAPPERHLAELLAIVDRASFDEASCARAKRVLTRLAEAEAHLHAVSSEEVHLHEVGAVDTLVDVCGALHALERLGVERLRATPPYVGGGTVHCAHGELPVPAPATLELLRGWTLRHGPGGERLTPTAAALLAELARPLEPGSGLRAEAVGYGAGQRDGGEGPPNLLRVTLGELGAADSGAYAPGREVAWELACQLDDATGEELGFLVEALRREGALDAWTTAVTMKKERPGVLVSALARGADRERLERVLLRHTPALGLRWTRVERREWARSTTTVALHGERVRLKRRHPPGVAPDEPPARIDLSPEYEDLARLARATGRPLRELEDEALRLALESPADDAP